MQKVVTADLNNPLHCAAIVRLLDEYAQDLAGGQSPLSAYCRSNLIAQMRQRNTIHCLLAYQGEAIAGLAICVEGFSTFNCRPLLNLHDLCVSENARGQGLGKLLLQQVCTLAQQLDCCKVTLEVLSGNTRAAALYQQMGFQPYTLDPAMGHAIMLQHYL
ncbi:GNAT family N-acetyltransferase [Chitinibacter sp. SCUT-21]|uniref:GNAT family N-acetyltransferase n=1 Tax=Chitinibacter sp. SCUT-21 TaxID=2970891 RepID=UPI0035A5F8E0